MKKTITLITITLFITSISAYAQWFSIGIKGGYSSILERNQGFENTFNIKSNLQNGFHLGLYIRMGRTWYIQPEALFNYHNYNSTLSYNNSNINNNKKYQTNTIDVPILLGSHIINTNMFKIRAMIGPRFNFNIGSTVAEEFNDIESLTETIRNTRLGLDCGIGFDIWRIMLDVRYNLMQDIYQYQNSEGTTLNKKPLHAIQASIGYRIAGDNKKKNTYKRR